MTQAISHKPSARIVALDTGQSDAELVSNALAGSRLAKEQLFRRYAQRVAGRVYRLLGSDAELEDVVQDAFVAAFSALGTLRQHNSFGGWLDAIATRTAIAVMKRRRLMRRFGLASAETVNLDLLISNAVPQDVATELRSIYSLIQRLPVSERVVLTLRRVEQLELLEIAEQTGLSLATVKRRLSKAAHLIGEQERLQREES